MTLLKEQLAKAGFSEVTSYINSGNILFESDKQAQDAARAVEGVITAQFKMDSELIKVRCLKLEELQAIVDKAPTGFGTEPDKYYSDVLFPLDTTSAEIMETRELHPDVDAAWEANGVVYYRRLGALRTKSRLSKLISKPIYKKITIRTWNTTVKLLDLLKNKD